MDDADRTVLSKVNEDLIQTRGVIQAVLAGGRPVTNVLYHRLIAELESSAALLDGRLTAGEPDESPTSAADTSPAAYPRPTLLPTPGTDKCPPPPEQERDK